MTQRLRGTPPLHVLAFGLRWPPETFIQAKLEQLAARGVRITVACADDAPTPSTPPGIRVVRVIPAGRVALWRAAVSLARLALVGPHRVAAVVRAARAPTAYGAGLDFAHAAANVLVYARLAALRPDLVHFEWSTGALHFHGLPDALGCASLVSVRGGDVEVYPHGPGIWFAAGYGAAFRRAAAVHCVSEATRDEALTLGLNPTKARVIRPAVDVQRFRPGPPDENRGMFTVVGIGWLSWRKGWEYALQAVALLAAAGVDVRFELVGPEPARELDVPTDLARVRHAISDLGLEARVAIRGAVSHGDVVRVLGQADALLHLSLAEGLPNVVLEAMASGVPVVAADVGGTREAITDGVEGLLVPPRDPQAAAGALLTLARDPGRGRTLAEAARARVESAFSLDRQVDLWLELYREVAATSPRKPLSLLEVGLSWPPEAFLQRKLQGLAERGFEVAVASMRNPARQPEPIDAIRLCPLPYWRESRIRATAGMIGDGLVLLARDPRLLVRVLRWWRTTRGEIHAERRRARLRLHLSAGRLRPDVAHFEWTSFAAACLPLLTHWRIPVVVSCHGSDVLVDPNAGGTSLATVFSRARAVHCVSRAIEDAAVALGLERSRAVLIPSAVDPAVFLPRRGLLRCDGQFVVVTVADLRWIKGYEYALAAVARLLRAGAPVRYEIVGAEPEYEAGQEARILAAAGDLGLDGRVRLRGQLRERDVVATLQRADAFLQASLSEGMPTAVLEAMACELPVVATDVGGTREVITHGVDGYLVQPRDAGAAADALEALWRDPEHRQALGRAARARVERTLSLERQLDAFESLYRGPVAA